MIFEVLVPGLVALILSVVGAVKGKTEVQSEAANHAWLLAVYPLPYGPGNDAPRPAAITWEQADQILEMLDCLQKQMAALESRAPSPGYSGGWRFSPLDEHPAVRAFQIGPPSETTSWMKYAWDFSGRVRLRHESRQAFIEDGIPFYPETAQKQVEQEILLHDLLQRLRSLVELQHAGSSFPDADGWLPDRREE